MEDTAAATLPDDIIVDILHRVPTDSAALFRCAVASKRWREFIANRAFLERCWTENAGRPSSRLGFLIQQRRDDVNIDAPYPPLYVPSLGSVIGARPRLLTDLLSSVADGLLDGAQPLAERHGLVVVRLFHDGVRGNSVDMAVCDLRVGACNVLPRLRLTCEASTVSCTILTGEDYPSSSSSLEGGKSPGPGYYYSAVFKLLTLVVTGHKCNDSEDCNLYTLSSATPTWGAPTKCFENMAGIGGVGFSLLQWKHDNAVVCRGVAHWLAWYLSKGALPKYYSLDVTVDTDLVSLTEISGPVHSHANNGRMLPMLGIAADGSLAMFCPRNGLGIIDMWTRKKGSDGGVWLQTKSIRLNVPRWQEISHCARMWRQDKGRTFLIVDNSWLVRRVDINDLTIEEELFPDGIGLEAMPVHVDWPVLFLSLLA